jgi:predicted RecB family nuclease
MARKRLQAAIERAQMICDGVSVTRLDARPIDVPTADVEIDVDIEFDTDGRVYMWGARVRRSGDESTAVYVCDFVEWGPLDGPAEHDLARRFAVWLRAQRDAATAAGESVKFFHWSHPESSRLRSILGAAEVDDLIGSEVELFVDLEKVFKANFFSLHGSSIKKVAPQFGFRWRVDDPGGATSQLYLAEVRADPDTEQAAAAKRWLLTYNEDDNAAMARIRDGMRKWKEG